MRRLPISKRRRVHSAEGHGERYDSRYIQFIGQGATEAKGFNPKASNWGLLHVSPNCTPLTYSHINTDGNSAGFAKRSSV